MDSLHEDDETMRERTDTKNGFWLAVLAAAAVTAIAALSAGRTAGRAFPSFLYDPTGSYSLVDMPRWNNDGFRLSRSSRIVEVDGRPVGAATAYLRFPGNRIADLLDSSASRGATARVGILEGSTRRTIDCELRRFGPFEILLLCVAYLGFGWFALLTTLLMREGAPESGGGMDLLALSSGLGFAFLAGFLDFHANAWLYPVFQTANLAIPLALFLLCFEYPFPVVAWSPAVAAVRWGCGGYFLFAFADQVVSPLLGVAPSMAPDSVDVATKAFLILTGSVIVARVARGRGRERASFVAASVASGGVLLALGAALAISLAFGIEPLGFAVNVLLPLVPTVFVLCFGYSAVRHNLLSVRTVLARSSFRIPMAFLSVATGTLLYTLGSSWAGRAPRAGILDAWLLLSLFGGCHWLFERALDRFVFRAAKSYRRTISDLGGLVAGTRDEQAISNALMEAASGLLPHHRVEVQIDRHAGTERLLPDADPWVFPMAVGSRTLGRILLSASRRSPILTDEDVVLLRMVAAVGAIGISNARGLAALETLHRRDIELTREGNALALQVFGAEIAHEIRYPISFFKYLLRELDARQPLEPQDIRLGRDEVERLERMVGAMGAFRHPPVATGLVGLADVANRSAALLKDVVERHGVAPEIAVPSDVRLECDEGLLVQLLANLLKNAIEAASPPKSVRLEMESREAGALAVVVRDSGPGLPDIDVFSPWASTKQTGRGIGLTVCSRVCREFGWEIDAYRDGGATCFAVTIPPQSVVREEGACA